jgi:hypothetical protein
VSIRIQFLFSLLTGDSGSWKGWSEQSRKSIHSSFS